jgi:hypothetical protein
MITHREMLELRYDGPIPPNALRELSMAEPVGLDRMSISTLEHERDGALLGARDRWQMAQSYIRSAGLAGANGHTAMADKYRANAAECMTWIGRLNTYADACVARLNELMADASAQRAAG